MSRLAANMTRQTRFNFTLGLPTLHPRAGGLNFLVCSEIVSPEFVLERRGSPARRGFVHAD